MAGSYAIGCIVGAYYIVRLRTGADVRASGSGNAGARNVFRSGNKTSAVLTFLWDAVKGVLAVWIAYLLVPRLGVGGVGGVAFLFVIIGHVWPVQLGFRGGKGVATAIGSTLTLALLGSSWPNLAGACVAWILVVIAHQPAFERHRNSLRSMTPTQANGS